MLATSQYQPGYDVAPGESTNHIAVLNYININTILNCYDLLYVIQSLSSAFQCLTSHWITITRHIYI